jgi:succinoglycan biosynthesis transport protein ExoP
MAYPLWKQPSTDLEAVESAPVSPLELLDYLRSHWVMIATSCGIAVLLTGIVSWMLPKQYTATASILIEPPAGNDPRGAMAVSTIYLESLKTYEHFASSDSLFRQSMERLKLRELYRGTPIDVLKRKVLHVSKPRDTKILEISVTLKDPNQAQRLANYIAEQTLGLNKALDRQEEKDLTEQSGHFMEVARIRLANAEKKRNDFLIANPIEQLDAEISNKFKLALQLRNDLSVAQADLADYEARAGTVSKETLSRAETGAIAEQIAATKARVNLLETEAKQIDKELAASTAVIERRKHDLEVLAAEVQAARAQYEESRTKNNDIVASAAFRGERLEIIDPGVVPERPSFPNIPLNLLCALLASFGLALAYWVVVFNYTKLRANSGRRRADD